MKLFRHKYIGKLFLLLFSVVIGTGSLFYTNNLVKRLKDQERKNIGLWAEAISLFNQADTNQNVDVLVSTIIESNNTVPVILTDENDSIIGKKNFDPNKVNKPGYLRKNLEKMKNENKPFVINLDNKHYNLIYYKDSIILTMLAYYPYVQLGIIIMFILVSYLAFNSSRKAERNQLWVGMSKETAHQLGTPTSSLAGWIEILQQKHPDIPFTRELSQDVQRLEKVTERFSRIGSKPAIVNENLNKIIINVVEYLKSRTSSRVRFTVDTKSQIDVFAPVNAALFEWVIEVIAKNAIDAMEGRGDITIRITENESSAIVDISDTGKGIPKSLFKKIFNPGFTTKKRGWGLGLSLARRIIEEYHRGRIFVRSSEVGVGSCIRIIIKKN